MDKEEFRIKLEEINRLVEEQDYKGAMGVVDSIDWRRVKNVRTLCVVGEIYAANRRYEDSKEIFLLAYHRAPIGKNILYRLIEVSLKMGDIDEAMEFYEEFLEIAPNDNTHYILKYKIYKAKKVSLEEQIKILEEYKEKEFTERWSYELARLYYKAGSRDKCLALCDEMVLWFNEGRYVIKALELKMRMGVLSGAEKARYESQVAAKFASIQRGDKNAPDLEEASTEDISDDDKGEEKSDPLAIGSIRMDERDINNAESFQEKFAKGFKGIFGGMISKDKEKDGEEDEDDESINDILAEENKKATAAIEKAAKKYEKKDPKDGEEISGKKPSDRDTIDNDLSGSADGSGEDTVPVFEPGKLQEKISQGLRDIFGGAKNKEEAEEEVSGDMDKASEEIREEMIKNISSKEEFDSVPDLEPEGAAIRKEASAKPDLSKTMKMPELNIPDSMKKKEFVGNIPIPEIPNTVSGIMPDFTADGEKEFDFNLEDTILAAATAQGIEIPKDTELPPKKKASEEESVRENKEESFDKSSPMTFYDDEEELTEEELRQAEAEFLEAPRTEKKEEPEKKNYEVPSLEPEEFISGDFSEKDKEQFDDGIDVDEIVSRKNTVKKPEGMNTEVFNFQQELKMVLGEEDDFISGDPFVSENRAEKQSEEIQALVEEESLTEEERLERFIESLEPKEERSILDIVPREKELRENEVKLFTYFVKVPGMKEQLINTLCDVQLSAADKTSKTGNIIVMGGRETGKTRLISGLIPAICCELNLEASKVAYVFAEQINGKDIASIVSKLSGGFLVIENANQLTQETVDQLDKAMEFRTDGLTVIIEDEKIGMRKLIARFPKFAKKFTSMINIPVFTNDELVNFAKVYTKENGYTIDQMGMLALYNLISVNQKEDEPMNIGVVKELIDNAIAKSQGGIRKLKRNFSKKHTDRDGYVVLYEKDFT